MNISWRYRATSSYGLGYLLGLDTHFRSHAMADVREVLGIILMFAAGVFEFFGIFCGKLWNIWRVSLGRMIDVWKFRIHLLHRNRSCLKTKVENI